MTRVFLSAFLALVLLAAPLAAEAQQPPGKVYRVGVPIAISREDAVIFQRTLEESLRELGYVVGHNLVMEYRFADSLDRIPDLVAQLVDARVDVLVAGSNRTTAAAKQATGTIPIVMVVVGDPVGAGFVSSLGKPGGNITGLSSDASPEAVGKQLQFLREVAPTVSRVAVLRNPNAAVSGSYWTAIQDIGPRLGATILTFDVRTAAELEVAFTAMKRDGAGSVYVFGDAFTYIYRRQIAELATKARLPTVAFLREMAEAGLLMSYGVRLPYYYRRAAAYVDKILKGAKPGDLPIEQPTKFEFIINLNEWAT